MTTEVRPKIIERLSLSPTKMSEIIFESVHILDRKSIFYWNFMWQSENRNKNTVLLNRSEEFHA